MNHSEKLALRITVASNGSANRAPEKFDVTVDTWARKINDDGRLNLFQVVRLIRKLLRPRKESTGLATLLGVVLVLIQVLRAGYLPDFDWASGAGAIVLASVFAVAIFLIAYLALLAAMPAVPLADISAPLIVRYVTWVFIHLTVVVGGSVLITVLGKWDKVNQVLEGSCAKWVVVAGFFVFTFVVAWFALPEKVAVDGVEKRLDFATRYFLPFVGLAVAPCVYLLLYFVLFRYRDGSMSGDFLFVALPAILIATMMILVLWRPRQLMFYYFAGGFVFCVLCRPASDVAFSVLGLGNCRIEFSLDDPKYSRDLEKVGIGEVEAGSGVYSAWLRLRLGTEFVLSAGADGWGRSGRVVSIPRTAIRGVLIQNRVASNPPKAASSPRMSNRPPCMGPSP